MRWLVLLLLTGCASGLQMTYESHPPGATLTESGKVMGQTPVTLNYNPPETFMNGGCVALKEVTARWISGASVATTVTACKSTGMSQRFVLQHPGPGMDVDANYALQLERNGIMRDAAWAEAFDRVLRQGQAIYPKQTTCNAIFVAGTMQTVCK